MGLGRQATGWTPAEREPCSTLRQRKENSTLPYAAGAPQEILTKTPRTRQRTYLLHSCITNHCCTLLYIEASAYIVEAMKVLSPSHPHQDLSVACCNLYWQYWQLHRKTNNKEGTDTAWVKPVQRAFLDFLMALSSSTRCGFHMHFSEKPYRCYLKAPEWNISMWEHRPSWRVSPN